MNEILKQLKATIQKYSQFDANKIPLCAAETFVSDFVKQALNSCLEGKYIMGNAGQYSNDFIGSAHLSPIMQLLSEECFRLFGAKYTDARPLTGMNTIMLIAMCLTKPGERVLLTTPDQGGHASVPKILDRLMVSYESIPYDYDKYQIDYIKTNERLKKGGINYLFFCQSDLLQPPDLTKLQIPSKVRILYDATQTMGLIIGKQVPNPLAQRPDAVLFGGTHKTLPGPTSGIIMSNDDDIIVLIDKKINPDYLRNVQINNITSVLLSLIEQEVCGSQYQAKTVTLANRLAELLEERHFNVAKIGGEKYTDTHQIFVLTSESECEQIFRNAIRYNITLNKKAKRLFGGFGIRLGTQEIARYGWENDDLRITADILNSLRSNVEDPSSLIAKIEELSHKKTPRYLLDDIFMN